MSLKVADIGEKELVKYIIANSKEITADDTAVTQFSSTNLISTCDMLIQSRHFPENMSYFNIGFKSVTVNVSDLAAMGAEPLGFLLAIAIPKDLELDSFKEIIEGVLSACDYYSIPLIGGDTNEASEIIISGTALGSCDEPLMMDNYSIGDVVAVTGDIGLAALGFELEDFNNIYVKKALKPLARINEGITLKNSGATSATDITDGLASELYQIKKDSFGFMIYEELLNISDEYKQYCKNLGLNYLDLIFHVGEDFELLFTMNIMLVSNNLYKKSSKTQKIRCEICANYCKIADGNVGVCRQHKNINGELFDESYGIVSSLSPDPIEKKPLNHFLPGTFTYSIGGFGCNMTCLHCQNYMISHEYDKNSRAIQITPEAIVENAINYNCQSIAWTYNEPTIHLPFSKKTSLLAKSKDLKVIYVSNGYFSQQSVEEILTFVDAFNIDLKSMSADFYKKVCGADLDVVLDNLKRVYVEGKHLEITNLIINGYNDSTDEINQLCDFVADELGPEVPLHFSRAFPYYKMRDISPTNAETLFRAKEIAADKGIENVYLGNI